MAPLRVDIATGYSCMACRNGCWVCTAFHVYVWFDCFIIDLICTVCFTSAYIKRETALGKRVRALYALYICFTTQTTTIKYPLVLSHGNRNCCALARAEMITLAISIVSCACTDVWPSVLDLQQRCAAIGLL